MQLDVARVRARGAVGMDGNGRFLGWSNPRDHEGSTPRMARHTPLGHVARTWTRENAEKGIMERCKSTPAWSTCGIQRPVKEKNVDPWSGRCDPRAMRHSSCSSALHRLSWTWNEAKPSPMVPIGVESAMQSTNAHMRPRERERSTSMERRCPAARPMSEIISFSKHRIEIAA